MYALSGFNWAKEIDEEDTEVEINDQNGFRTKIEYKNEDDKRFKVHIGHKLREISNLKNIEICSSLRYR